MTYLLCSNFFQGLGWKDEEDTADNTIKKPINRAVEVVVKGKNVGYGATCEYMVQAGLSILQEKELMPGEGGVLTPGYAFANTTIVDRLIEKGCTFEVKVKDI